MSIPCTQQSPWVGTDPPAPTLDGAGGQASPTVAVGQLGPLVGERGGAPPAVAPQQDAAPLYQLPLGPALRGGRLLCRERDTVTARATRGTREGGMGVGGLTLHSDNDLVHGHGVFLHPALVGASVGDLQVGQADGGVVLAWVVLHEGHSVLQP